MSNRRLRIAFDNSLTRRNVTGTGTYATHLIQELSGTPEVDLTVFNGPEFGAASNGLAGRVARNLANRYWMNSQFPRLLREGKFDVQHGPAFVMPRKSYAARVVTVFDMTFRMFPDHIRSSWGDYLIAKMPGILQSVAAVICISEQTKKDLLHFYPIAAEKVHVVYCGIDHSRFRPEMGLDEDWARSLGVRDGYGLHVGSLVMRKNIPVLLRAVALLRDRGKWGDRQLVLAGREIRSFPGAAEVYETIGQLNLSDVVVLAGHVPDEHVAGLYAHASMLVMPTLYEGFGLPILESMAAGTPVVASDNSSIPEVAGNAGILVPTGDEQALAEAMLSIFEDISLAARLRERGLLQAAKFSWRRMGAETVEVYRKAAVGSI